MSSHILNVYEHYTAVLLCMKHKSFVKFSENFTYSVVFLHIFLFYDHLYKEFPQYIN